MPSRNIIRQDVSESFYHVYARGSNKQRIFLDEKDKEKFISLFARYLSQEQLHSNTGEPYPHFLNRVELMAYCLMDNHFHLLVYQGSVGGISAFMRSLMTSYVRYFNLKYKKTGSLFESRYKSSRIDDETYFVHISRYIHLNRRNWKYYKYSSINYYRKANEPEWLSTKRVLESFSSRKEYVDFLYDYEGHKEMLEEIKYDIVNS